MEKGLLQPIVVRPVGEDRFEVVAGTRRFEACRRLKISSIPCYISELDDKEAYEVSLIENLQRKTLNPIEEGSAFKRYVDEFGYGSLSELAKRISKSPSYVSRRIALLSLPAELKDKLLRSAKLSMAQEFTSLDDEQKEKLTELITEDKISKNEIRHIIRHIKEQEKEATTQPFFSHYSLEETRRRGIDRAFAKYIALLRFCMMRLDEILDSLDENEWIVSDLLMQYRRSLHTQIDGLIRVKSRTQHSLPPM